MTEYPSLPEQGKNLAKFTFEVVKQAFSSNALFVSSEVKQERLKICSTCEFYDAKQIRCKHCGCYLEHKANFALDSCPIDKWTISDTDWVNEKFNDVMNRVEGNTSHNDTPRFPLQPEIDDVYEWNGRKWKWNGEMWDFIFD